MEARQKGELGLRGSVRKIRSLLTRRQKASLILLLAMTILLSIIETVGISAIMPFISMAANPDLLDSGYYKQIYDFFGFVVKSDFVIACGFLLIFFYLFRGLYTQLHAFVLNRIAFGMYSYFAFRLIESYLGLPYREFVRRNSAQLRAAISSESMRLSVLVQRGLMLLSEIFTAFLLYGLLVAVNWKMTLVLTLILGVKVLLITHILSPVLKRHGDHLSEMHRNLGKVLNEAFGNFKLIKLKGNEQEVLRDFEMRNVGVTQAQILHNSLNVTPRIILEITGFSMLIGVVIYILFRYESAAFVIPVVSMYALALYRMLPAISRMLECYNYILFNHKALELVHTDLSYPLEGEGGDPVDFSSSIKLQEVSFAYDEANAVLHGVSLEIAKGQKVAFVGESGSGKSTLIDLLIGIYHPRSGEILIDGVPLTQNNIRAWRKKIGYIPQSIYLIDGTVAENVAFGDVIDPKRVEEALKKANIWEFLAKKEGMETLVGEGGIKLSGGQKQRVGIARALYGDPEILVLDEATSALDNETESRIMDEIYEAGTNKTLLIIAHRLSTVSRCERVIRMHEGYLVEDKKQEKGV